MIIIQSLKRSSVPLDDNLDISFRYNWILSQEGGKKGEGHVEGAWPNVGQSDSGSLSWGGLWILPSSAVSRPTLTQHLFQI